MIKYGKCLPALGVEKWSSDTKFSRNVTRDKYVGRETSVVNPVGSGTFPGSGLELFVPHYKNSQPDPE